MKKLYILTLIIYLFFNGSALAQVVYNGNGNTGFGGTLGGSTLTINDNGTTISFDFARGGSNLDNAIVIYIDSKTGGFNNTSGFTDDSDGLRSAISSFKSGNGGATITFPAGFEADYAIAFDAGFAGIWELVNGGSHAYINSANLSPTNVNANANHLFDADFSEIGATDTFDFVVTYISTTAYLSNEVIGDTSSIIDDGSGTNPGFSGSITFSNSRTYTSSTLGVNNLKKSNVTLRLYSSDNNTLHINGLDNRSYELSIYDTLGRVVNNILSNNSKTDISFIQKGVYFAALKLEDGSSLNTKFLKQ